MYNRITDFDITRRESAFLWGARQTGKSTLLKARVPDALYYDLLLSDVDSRLVRDP